MRSDDERVVDLYLSGVDAVVEVGARLGPDDWSQLACGTWTATATAAHLVVVAGWYDQWLDRAVSGDATAPFPPEEFDRRNDATVAELGLDDGPSSIARFRTAAPEYLERARLHWELPYGFPLGTTTVGLHVGVAATEWHLHAWDLSTAVGPLHEPVDAHGLFVAAGRAFAATKRPLQRAALERVVPLAARRSPWQSLLTRSGR